MTNQLPPENKIMFAITPEGYGDGIPLVIMGVPTGAWEYMRDGNTHTFDLTSVGIPVKLVIFGGKDQTAVYETLSPSIDKTTVDARGTDFSVQPPSKRKPQ